MDLAELMERSDAMRLPLMLSSPLTSDFRKDRGWIKNLQNKQKYMLNLPDPGIPVFYS